MSRPLDIDTIRQIVKDLPEPTICELKPGIDEHIKCPVCFVYRHQGMLACRVCRQFTCCRCAEQVVMNCHYNKCPLCGSTPPDGKPLFSLPTPVEQEFLKKIEFQCPLCAAIMLFHEISEHVEICVRSIQEDETNPVEPEDESKVVSNAAIDKSSFWSKRQLVCNFRGKQLTAKVYPRNHLARRIKDDIAELIGAESNSIKLYRFEHREIDDWEAYESFATNRGVNHITVLKDLDLNSGIAELRIERTEPIEDSAKSDDKQPS